MCDGKLASKRDVVILSIKPKRPDYPSSQKLVPVSELLQEWDKLDAYYRGQLLKLTKSFTKSAQKDKDSKHRHRKNSRHASPNNEKVNSKHSNHSNSKSSCPVSKKNNKSSLSSDQFTELFGDENLFSPTADTNNNSSNRHHNSHHNSSSKNSNKLLHSRSLNSLFDEDELLDNDLLPAPPPSSRSRSISSSRKSSLTSVNGNLVVSIPVLSVQQQRDNYRSGNKNSKRLSKYFSDDDNDSSGVSEDSLSEDDEPDNYLSVPRDNFKVQYGTKQKTRVALLEESTGRGSPRLIVPIHVAPYKPPTAQGLNGVQIQKILYHKNDKINYASPTTTTARTPDKPPDSTLSLSSSVSLTKSAKVSSENSPVSTISPSPVCNRTSTTVSPPSGDSNNNATPKPAASQSPPDFASPKSDQGYKSSSSTSSSSSGKLSSPPINSTTGNPQKLKRPISLTENYSSSHSSSSSSGYGKKQRLGSSSSSDSSPSPSAYNFLPVTSSNYAFSSLSTASSYSSSTSSLNGDAFMENDHHNHHHQHNNKSPSRSRHSSTSSTTSSSSSRFSATADNAIEAGTNSKSSSTNNSGSPPSSNPNSKQKLNIINKNPSFVKPPSTANNSSSSSAGDHSVFLAPAAVSITDRIIKKASRPQPELIERQRRRRMESNQRKSYALQKGDEHEERESIDLSMKSFEMIWNVPLLSPLRSP